MGRIRNDSNVIRTFSLVESDEAAGCVNNQRPLTDPHWYKQQRRAR